MIRPYALAFLIFFFCLLLAIIAISILPSQSSMTRYLTLIRQTKEEQVLASSHKQRREGVRKDLLVARPDHRLQAVLTCPVSELTLSHESGDAEVVENLKKFQCLMQEELYNEGAESMQIVRDFNAMSGRFSYQRQFLTAERVFVSRYTLPGHQLPDIIKDAIPTMKGVARSAELHFGSGFKFKARHLKATFYAPGEEK